LCIGIIPLNHFVIYQTTDWSKKLLCRRKNIEPTNDQDATGVNTVLKYQASMLAGN